MKDKQQEFIEIDGQLFVGQLIAENEKQIKLYEFDEIPYIDRYTERIKKEFPDFKKDIGEFLNHTYIMYDKNNNIIYEVC